MLVETRGCAVPATIAAAAAAVARVAQTVATALFVFLSTTLLASYFVSVGIMFSHSLCPCVCMLWFGVFTGVLVSMLNMMS